MERYPFIQLPEIRDENCIGCGDCVALCPPQALELDQGKAKMVCPEECDYCAECEEVCPTGAITCPLEILLLEAD